MPLKVAIICSNHLFGEGLKSILEEEPGVEIIGTFYGGKEFLNNLHTILLEHPDIILSDDSADFNALLTLPSDFFSDNRLKILLIGDKSLRFSMNRQFKDLIARGVVGILPPSSDSYLLRKAMKAVCSGELWLDRETLMKVLAHLRNRETNVHLGTREKDIISHICQGFRNKEIALKLNISEQTVKSHCNRIYKKLGVSDRLQLALYCHKVFPGDAEEVNGA